MRFLEKNTKGQHAMEYVILLTLVMAGIIMGGPYVVRSWNANIKGWEDSAKDSLQDPLLTSAQDSVSLPGCNAAEDWSNMGCGESGISVIDACTGQLFNCDPEEVIQTLSYSPAGCQCHKVPIPSYLRCRTIAGAGCCSHWDLDDDDNPNLVEDPSIDDCGINAEPDCPNGEYRRTRTCDGGTVVTECNEAEVCKFHCQTPPIVVGTYYDEICPGDDADLVNNTTHYSLVNQGACTDDLKCEFQCITGSQVSADGNQCEYVPGCGLCYSTKTAGDPCYAYNDNSLACGLHQESLGCIWQPLSCCGTCSGTYGTSDAYCSGEFVDCSLPSVQYLNEADCERIGCTCLGSDCGSTDPDEFPSEAFSSPFISSLASLTNFHSVAYAAPGDPTTPTCGGDYGHPCGSVPSTLCATAGCNWISSSSRSCARDFFSNAAGCSANAGCTWTPVTG
ncbi:MAG TPA: hypothetical protein PKV41_05315, partial [Candidatus Omnitrophota bacterium]|nr:hypothetical protein [Candidatus Omnitrophota bacterium]